MRWKRNYKNKTMAAFQIDEDLLREFDEFARKEFGSRSKALVFLVRIYVETRRESSLLKRLLKL